jgi:protein involved in polysaccharide export with SLBB domain
MKKFFYSAVVALAFCAVDARAARLQVGSSVRVGPASEEMAADASAAPAPKKDEKKVKPDSAAKEERRGDAAKEIQGGRGGESNDQTRASDKTQEPASLSNTTASTVTPLVTNKTSATSDAPSKPGADTNVPVGAPVKSAVGAEGASDSNKTQPHATSSPTANSPNPSAAPATAAVSLASVYRIGIGDVLDIRLLNGQDPRQSTLYPVLAGGVLDFPLLHDPLTVTGMTTDELAAQLIAELRHRSISDRPQVRVSVREYASHAVLVSGMVNDPGTKILRREAIPLYVVVAEAQPKPEAGRAVIISNATGRSVTVDLNDAAALNTLVQSGDVVSLTVRPPEYFYVGGEIGSPGQKDFHAGMTLTQALLASGGVTRLAGEHVRVARQGADGRLVSTDYNLREIEGGVAPDPTLQPGDRIEVSAAVTKRK